MEQLEDLLDYALSGSGQPATTTASSSSSSSSSSLSLPLFALAGHSTGGGVGALAASHLFERPVLQLFSMNPALYAEKPLVAQVR